MTLTYYYSSKAYTELVSFFNCFLSHSWGALGNSLLVLYLDQPPPVTADPSLQVGDCVTNKGFCIWQSIQQQAQAPGIRHSPYCSLGSWTTTLWLLLCSNHPERLVITNTTKSIASKASNSKAREFQQNWAGKQSSLRQRNN